MSSSPVYSEVRVTRSIVLYVCFADRYLSFCTFSFGPLYCLFFFDIRILIAPLVSSNSSSKPRKHHVYIYFRHLQNYISKGRTILDLSLTTASRRRSSFVQ